MARMPRLLGEPATIWFFSDWGITRSSLAQDSVYPNRTRLRFSFILLSVLWVTHMPMSFLARNPIRTTHMSNCSQSGITASWVAIMVISSQVGLAIIPSLVGQETTGSLVGAVTHLSIVTTLSTAVAATISSLEVIMAHLEGLVAMAMRPFMKKMATILSGARALTL